MSGNVLTASHLGADTPGIRLPNLF